MKALTLFLLLASIPLAHADETINDIINCERQEETPILTEEVVELSSNIVDVSTVVIEDQSLDKEVKSEEKVQVISELAQETTNLLEEVADQKEQQISQTAGPSQEKQKLSQTIQSKASSLLTATTKFFKRQYQVAKPQVQKAYSYTTSKLKQLGGFLFGEAKKQKEKVDNYLDKKEEERQQALAKRAASYKEFNLQNDQLSFNDKAYRSVLVKDINELKSKAPSVEAQYVINEHRIAFVDQQKDELIWLDSLKLKAIYKKDIVVANLRIAAIKDLTKKESLKKDYEELNRQYQSISSRLSNDAYSAEDLIGLHRLNLAANDFTAKLSRLNSDERALAKEEKQQKISESGESKQEAPKDKIVVIQQQKKPIQSKPGEISLSESQQKLSVKGENYDVYDVEF